MGTPKKIYMDEWNGGYEVNADGSWKSFSTSQYVDEDGNPIARTPLTHPYSYDAYVIWGKKDKKANAVYSDRLYEWDYKKYDRLCEKHWGNQAQYWDERDADKVQAFLRDYNDNPKLILTMIMKCCNVSSGYPIWIFFYKDK